MFSSIFCQIVHILQLVIKRITHWGAEEMMFYVGVLSSASLTSLLFCPRCCEAQLKFNELKSFIFRGAHPCLCLEDGLWVSFRLNIWKDHSLFHLWGRQISLDLVLLLQIMNLIIDEENWVYWKLWAPFSQEPGGYFDESYCTVFHWGWKIEYRGNLRIWSILG